MANVTTLPLAALVEDMALYPRHAVDDGNVAALVNALAAGATLPPLVADEKSKRLVDGWHRLRAFKRVLGAEGVVDVELRKYKSDREAFLDAVKLNSMHGRKLDRIDQVRVAVMGKAFGIEEKKIAVVLHVPEQFIKKLRIRIATAPAEGAGTITGGREVALKSAVRHLAGTELTADQVRAHRMAPGTSYLLIMRQLIDALKVDLLNRADEKQMLAIRELAAEATRYVKALGPA